MSLPWHCGWRGDVVVDDRGWMQHYDSRPMADRSLQALGSQAQDDHRWDRGTATLQTCPRSGGQGTNFGDENG